jgi:hypothetical protein
MKVKELILAAYRDGTSRPALLDEIMALPRYANKDRKDVDHTISQMASLMRRTGELAETCVYVKHALWTDAEDEVLISMADKGDTAFSIATVLGRSLGSVQKRLVAVKDVADGTN